MRVFLSSVRRGLEIERDSLPGLIKAIGHEPVRFEDFTAQPTPSRQACLDGVDSCDAYVLLLGPNYGHVFPETGQSATHDEWVEAQNRGLHRLVFRKLNIDMEHEQEVFVQQVGNYGSGVFYDTFTHVGDLLPKVASALRQLASSPSALTYEPLGASPQFSWKDEREQANRFSNLGGQRGLGGKDRGLVELHVIPLGALARSARLMRSLATQLIPVLRSSGALPPEAGATPIADAAGVVVELDGPDDRRATVYPSRLRGVRLAADGQLSAWWTLPGDSMAAILDAAELTDTLTDHLRLIGGVYRSLGTNDNEHYHGAAQGDRFAIAVGLGGSLIMVSEATVTGVARQSASFGSMSDVPVRVLPEESVSSAAFDRGASEVAADLVASLLESFRERR